MSWYFNLFLLTKKTTMKNLKIVITVVVLALLTSCGGNQKPGKSNKFFGDLPKLSSEIMQPKWEMEKLEKKANNISSEKELKNLMLKAQELEKKSNEKEEEIKPKIKEYTANSGLSGKEIPFEVSKGVDECLIESIKIDNMQGDWLNLSVKFNLLNPTEKFLKNWEGFRIYFSFVDKDDNEIFKDDAIFIEKNYTEGKISSTSISLSIKQLASLGNFAKIIVSEAKYK